MLKKILFSALILFCYTETSFPQETTDGAFGALEFKSMTFKSHEKLLTGGRFGWVINKTFSIGGGYYVMSSDVNIDDKEAAGADVNNLNYGGLEFEYYYLNKSPFHSSVSLLLGGGGIAVEIPSEGRATPIKTTLNLLIYEPKVSAEYTVVKWFNVSAGISYRFVTNLKGELGINNKDLSGLSGCISFRFGDYR